MLCFEFQNLNVLYAIDVYEWIEKRKLKLRIQILISISLRHHLGTVKWHFVDAHIKDTNDYALEQNK